MTSPLVMETVGGYGPLAGSGSNTFRRLSDRYAAMKPGDPVSMNFVEHAGGRPYVVEVLRVRSVVFGPLGVLLDHHAFWNHGATKEKVMSRTGLLSILRDVYGAELALSEPFVVVYFD